MHLQVNSTHPMPFIYVCTILHVTLYSYYVRTLARFLRDLFPCGQVLYTQVLFQGSKVQARARLGPVLVRFWLSLTASIWFHYGYVATPSPNLNCLSLQSAFPIFSKMEIDLLYSQHLRSMCCQSLILLCILYQDVADKERVSPLNVNFPQRRPDDKFCHPRSSAIQNREKVLPPCMSCSCLFAAFSNAEIILHGYVAHLSLCRVKTAEIYQMQQTKVFTLHKFPSA